MEEIRDPAADDLRRRIAQLTADDTHWRLVPPRPLAHPPAGQRR